MKPPHFVEQVETCASCKHCLYKFNGNFDCDFHDFQLDSVQVERSRCDDFDLDEPEAVI